MKNENSQGIDLTRDEVTKGIILIIFISASLQLSIAFDSLKISIIPPSI